MTSHRASGATVALVMIAGGCNPTQEPVSPQPKKPPDTAPSAHASAVASTTAAREDEPPPTAIPGHRRCDFVLSPPPTKRLDELGALSEVYGGGSFCALDEATKLWCGDVDEPDALFAHPVAAPTRVSVTRGGYCALDATGRGACVVDVPYTVGGRPFPAKRCVMQLSDTRYVTVHAYEAEQTNGMPFNYYLCSVTDGGETSCLRGLFRHDDDAWFGMTVPEPDDIAGLEQTRELALPGSCAIDQQGMVSCWREPAELNWSGPQHGPPPGLRSHDRFSTKPWQPKATPQAALPKIEQIASGEEHTCALDRGGAVWCWGRNEVRQLGFKMRLPPPSYEDAPALVEHAPTKVKGLGRVKRLAVGSMHTCAERVTGEVLCWGHNDQGQLGNKRSDCHAPGHGRGVTMRCAGPGVVRGIKRLRALSAQGKLAAYVTSEGALGWIGR